MRIALRTPKIIHKQTLTDTALNGLAMWTYDKAANTATSSNFMGHASLNIRELAEANSFASFSAEHPAGGAAIISLIMQPYAEPDEPRYSAFFNGFIERNLKLPEARKLFHKAKRAMESQIDLANRAIERGWTPLFLKRDIYETEEKFGEYMRWMAEHIAEDAVVLGHAFPQSYVLRSADDAFAMRMRWS